MKNVLARVFIHFEFIEAIIKYGKGIGWTASLDQEIKFLIGKHKSSFTLFDVGANKGDFSILVSKAYPKSSIHSFEPSKITFDLLNRNVMNYSNINPVKLAFGSERKEMNLHYDFDTSGLASLYKRDLSHLGINFETKELVNVQTIDEWVDANNIIPDFIKIDVEGFELSVLKGAVKTLKNVIAVQFEFGGTAIDAKTHFRDYWNFFQELNFSIHRYTPLGLLKINEYCEREELYEYMNYIAVPFESNKIINLETLL